MLCNCAYSPAPAECFQGNLGDVVTAVGRRFLVRGGARMGSGSVELSFTHSRPQVPEYSLEAKTHRPVGFQSPLPAPCDCIPVLPNGFH